MKFLLPFQRTILNKLLKEDALCIVGQGLGLERILVEFCRICSTQNALVVLLNCEPEQELIIQEHLLELCGIVSVTSRILLVDMLNDNIPLHLITGIIVNNAHSAKADGNEAFILKLYKEKNSQGFIKALSDQPGSFIKDFAGVEFFLKFLRLRKLHLWPRFQVDIKNDLSAKIQVIEHKQPMSQKMIEAQQTILDCMIATIDYDDIEYSITFEFERKIRQSLAPYWHRVNAKTKKLVSDLSTLRFLMNNLMDYDCVLYNTYLDSLLVSSVQSKSSVFSTAQESEWMLTDSGNLLFNVLYSKFS
ncbi:hypothetical protein BB561_005855 [Smittium simulii]|uniref:Uncharacterized protein n=1 Tax=Smittium simulii TaxID=133385 RepID=A0A2T9Y813_9FUNG|nr:hypothetical protein BB561_005855 [Smittium simulii]